MSESATAPDYARLLAGQASLRGRSRVRPRRLRRHRRGDRLGPRARRRARRRRRPQRRQGRGARGALRAAGHDAIGVAMDAHSTDEHPRRRSTPSPARFGSLDLLVNCVGIQREERHAEVSEAAFDEVVQVNLKAAMFLSQAAARAPGRRRARRPRAAAARCTCFRCARSSACATAAIRPTARPRARWSMLIKQHAVELSAHGITVNGVAPTVVRGEMGAHWLANPATRERILARIPLGRVAEPEDVVGAALFFCSPAASFVTGQILYVDGGITATQ